MSQESNGSESINTDLTDKESIDAESSQESLLNELPEPITTTIPYFNNIWKRNLFSNPKNAGDDFHFSLPKETGADININNISCPTTDDNETKYANSLQNYYDYYPRDKSNTIDVELITGEIRGTKITKLTSLYIQSVSELLITMLFIHLDQNHDFHVTSRDAIEYTSDEYLHKDISKEFFANMVEGVETIIENPCNNKWIQDSIRTSFFGGKSIFSIMFINDFSFQKLTAGGYIDVNGIIQERLIELIQAKVKFSVNPRSNTIDIDMKAITHGLDIKIDDLNEDNKECSIVLLFLNERCYDTGMHRVWDYFEKRHLYVITLDSLTVIKNPESETEVNKAKYEVNKPKYEFYKYCEMNLVIPRLSLNIQNLITKYAIGYKKDKFIQFCNYLDDKPYEDSLKEDFVSLKNKILNDAEFITMMPMFRGARYSFNGIPPENYAEMIFFYLLKLLFETNTPQIHNKYTLNNLSNQSKITDAIQKYETNKSDFIKKGSEPYYGDKALLKQVGSVNDTGVTPPEYKFISTFNKEKIMYNDAKFEDVQGLDYPYKFSIVSGTTDGSGQGGQTIPEYHPPDIDIYMVLFGETDRQLKGCVIRLTFLTQILGNIINRVNKGVVDNHFVYVDLTDIDETYTDNPNEYSEKIQKLLIYVKDNTYLLESEEKLVLKLGDGTIKNWYKYVGVDSAKVSEINGFIKKTTEMLNKIDKNNDKINEDGEIIEGDISSIFSENEITKFKKLQKENIIELITSSDLELLQLILRVSQQLYKEDAKLRSIFPRTHIPKEFYEDATNIYPRNLNFEIAFLLRNKYDGDKSRATDTVFNNKSQFIEPFQFSLDENTLFTAEMFGISDLWATNGRNPNIFLAPYITKEDKMPVLGLFHKDKLIEGMSSTGSDNVTKSKIFKSKTSKIDDSLITSEPRVRKPSSIMTESSPTEKKKTSKLKKISIESPTTDVESLQDESPKEIPKEIPKEVPESVIESASEAVQEPVAKKGKNLFKKGKKDTKGGAVKSISNALLESSYDLNRGKQYDNEIVLPNVINMPDVKPKTKIDVVIKPQIQDDDSEKYRKNMIYQLRTTLETINEIETNYDVILEDLTLNVSKIQTEKQFYISFILLDIKTQLKDAIVPSINITHILNILTSINEETSLDTLVNINSNYLHIFNSYFKAKNIHDYGYEYFLYDSNSITNTITNNKIGGGRYNPKTFRKWINNSYHNLYFIFKYFEQEITRNHEFEEKYEIILSNYNLIYKIFNYLTSANINYLNYINNGTYANDQNANEILFSYYSLSFYLLRYITELIEYIQDTLGLDINRAENIEDDNVEDENEELVSKTQKENKYYNYNDIFNHLAGKSNTLPFYLKFIDELSENSTIIILQDADNEGIVKKFNEISTFCKESIAKLDTTSSATSEKKLIINNITNCLLMFFYSNFPEILNDELINYAELRDKSLYEQYAILYNNFISPLIANNEIIVTKEYEKDKDAFRFICDIIDNSGLILRPVQTEPTTTISSNTGTNGGKTNKNKKLHKYKKTKNNKQQKAKKRQSKKYINKKNKKHTKKY